MEETDLLAVIEQCRPDRPDLLPVLWPLASDQPCELGLMLINFYITVQLLYNKKKLFNTCDTTLVKKLWEKVKATPIDINQELRPLIKIRAKKNLMAAGVFHVLLIRPKSGQLLSWGSTQGSILGHSSSISRYSGPKPVELFHGLYKQRLNVICVAAGRAHSMALTDCGLYAWGSSKHGQLGLGNKVLMAKRPTLVKVLAKINIVGIAAGNYHSAAWDDQGKAWTWGWGVHGQLGHGNIMDEFLPSRLTYIPDRVLSIECGYAHTLVLTVKGQVWTFGCGLFGQLGVGEMKKSTRPCQIMDLNNIAHIACGHFHNLAFDKEGQKLYIWGCNPQVLRVEAQQKRKNKMMAAATAAAAADHETNINIHDDNGSLEDPASGVLVNKKLEEMVHLTPALVDTSLFKVAAVAAGNQHSLIITSEGSVLAFGRNLDGQLGIGSRKEAKLPTLVSGLKDDVIIEVAASGEFSLAMSDAGSVFAWGNNSGGQLGKPPLDDANANKDGLNSKVVVMKSTKRIIR